MTSIPSNPTVATPPVAPPIGRVSTTPPPTGTGQPPVTPPPTGQPSPSTATPHHQWVAEVNGGVPDVSHPAGDVDAVFGREFDLGRNNHVSVTGGIGLRDVGSSHSSPSLLAGAHMENPLFRAGGNNFVLETGLHGEYNFGHGFHLGGSLGVQYQIPLSSREHGPQLNLQVGGTAGTTDFHSVHPGGYAGVEVDINDRLSVGGQVNIEQNPGGTVTGVNVGATFRFGGGGGH